MVPVPDTVPAAQIIQIDDVEKQHLEQIAGHVSLATNSKTGVPSIQPAIDQEVLDDQTKKEVEDYTDPEEKPKEEVSKLSYFIPALQKRVRTTKALNFLGKKMEWMNKKNGGGVVLKEN